MACPHCAPTSASSGIWVLLAIWTVCIRVHNVLQGLRLVLLLHDTIQQLRTDISAGAPKDRLATLSSVVVDSFLLLAECAKDPSVELRLFDKLVRQLYVTALVALAAPRPLHASLAVVRPHADALLSALASHCKAAER